MAKSTRWKTLERTAAAKLGGRRVTEPWCLFRERPDVLVDLPGGRRLIVDCKAYRRFSVHSMLEAIEAKYCAGANDIPVVVTKHERQAGECATVPLDFLAGLLAAVRDKEDFSHG